VAIGLRNLNILFSFCEKLKMLKRNASSI